MSDNVKYLAYQRFRPWVRKNSKNLTPERLRLHDIAHRFFILKQRISNEEFRDLWSAYLRSKYWFARRSLVFQRAKGLCEHCRAAPCEECHHLCYNHRFDEPIEDLLGVCSECHRFFSKRGPDPAFNREVVSLETMNEKLDRILNLMQ